MTVRVIDQGAEAPSDAASGDYLLRRTGSDVEVGRVVDGKTEWLGSVPADSLPSLEGDLDQSRLDIAVRGIESALVERGG